MKSDAFSHPKHSVETRRGIILQMVEEQGFCTIAELSEACGVSEMTVRRDVQILVEQDLLRSFHGGVSSFPSNDFRGSDYRERETSEGELKRILAAEAASMIDAGDSVAIDAGTTLAALAEEVAPRTGIHVVTASLPVIVALSKQEHTDLTVLGGNYHSESQSMSGPGGIQAIENLHVDTFFLAASRLSERGAYCANDFDAVTKRALIEIADRVVLVADSSKFNHSAIAKVCGWESIDEFVVDDGLSADMADYIRERGVSLRTVPKPMN